MSTISVIIPWRAGDPAREAALAYVRRRYAEEYPELEVVLGELDPEADWSKGLAVHGAIHSTDADVLVIADADVWTDGLNAAIEKVVDGVCRWAMPHTTVVRLGEKMTQTVLGGARLRITQVDRRPYRGITGGGMVIIRRDLYESAPFDARFIGWGHEDQSAGLAWRCLAGQPWRGNATLWHLWHPPQPKITMSTGSRTSKLLLERYRKAARDPQMTRELIAEGLEILG